MSCAVQRAAAVYWPELPLSALMIALPVHAAGLSLGGIGGAVGGAVGGIGGATGLGGGLSGVSGGLGAPGLNGDIGGYTITNHGFGGKFAPRTQGNVGFFSGAATFGNTGHAIRTIPRTVASHVSIAGHSMAARKLPRSRGIRSRPIANRGF